MQKVLYINKPKGITSFDVCFKLRKALHTKAIGHTGTLDPNATGVMVILVDKTCKANQFLVSDTKEYVATVLFGVRTDTLDIDGNIIEERKCVVPSKEVVEEVLASFLGKSIQIPPMTSAIKVNGKKLYEYQREGKEVEIPKREIEVFSIELLSLDAQEMVFRTRVSSGTYIRSLMEDILKKMDMIGTLKDLVRTKVDQIHLEDCDELDAVLQGEYQSHDLISLFQERYPLYQIESEAMEKDVKNGKPLKLPNTEEKVVIVKEKEVLAVYGKSEDGLYRSLRGLF